MTNLRALLKVRGKKNIWLAEQLGVHHVTVSNWVRGIHTPDAATVRRLANLLDCEPDELVGGFPLMTDEERRHLRAYRLLPAEARLAIDQMMQALSGKAVTNEEKLDLAAGAKKAD